MVDTFYFVIRIACLSIIILDFCIVLLHKIMKKSAKRRHYKSEPIVLIILDSISLGLILMFYVNHDDYLELAGLMIRFHRVYKYFYYSTIKDYRLSLITSVSQYGIATAYVLHSCICFWMYIYLGMTRRHSDKSYIRPAFYTAHKQYYNITWRETDTTDYTLCLFYITGVFTLTGYGFVRDKHLLEQFTASFIGLVSLTLFFATFIAIHTNNRVEINRRKCTYVYKIRFVLKAITHKKVSPILSKKVLLYFQTFLLKERGQSDAGLFRNLPIVFKRIVFLDIYWHSLTKAYLFKNCTVVFLRAIASAMVRKIYNKDDIIIRQGDTMKAYMFVAWGSVRILLPEDTETTLITLGTNSSMGALSLMYSYRSNVQIVADSYCVLYCLCKKDFWKTFLWKCRLQETSNFRDYFSDRIIYAKYMMATKCFSKSSMNLIRHQLRYESKTDLHNNNYHLERINLRNDYSHTDNYVLSKVQDRQYRDDIFYSTNFPWKLNAESQFLTFWKAFVMGTVTISFLLFASESAALQELSYTEYFQNLVGVIYFADVLIQSITIIEDAEGVYSDTWVIFAMRCTSITFIADIIAAIPIITLAQTIIDIHNPSFRVLHITKQLKMIPLLSIILRFENGFRLNLKLVKLVTYLSLIIILSLSFGTAYFLMCLIMNEHGIEYTWIDSLYEKTKHRIYANSNHLSVSLIMYYLIVSNLTNTGYIVYTGSIEMYFLVIMSFVSMFLFCHLVSDFTATFILSNELREVDGIYLTICDKFLMMKGASQNVRFRIIALLAAKFQYCPMGLNRELLYEIPKELYTQVNLAKYMDLCSGVPLFQNLSDDIMMAILKMSKIEYFPPNDFLIYCGDYIEEIYIIEQGFCKLTSQQSGRTRRIIGPKDHFGAIEACLEQPQVYDVQTCCSVTALVIRMQDLKLLFFKYPYFKKDLTDIAKYYAGKAILQRVFLNTYNNTYEEKYAAQPTSWFVFNIMQDLSVMEKYRREFTGVAGTLGRYLMHRSIMPDGNFLIRWEVVYNMAAVVGAIVIPSKGFVGSMHPAVEIPLYMLLYTIYVLTIYFRFHVCYYNKYKILVTHPISTARHYFCGSLLIDLIALFPMSEIMVHLKGSNLTSPLQFFALTKLLLLYRFSEIRFQRDLLQKHKLIYELMFFVSLAAVILVNAAYILYFICLYNGIKDLYINNYIKGRYLLTLAVKVNNPNNVALTELPSSEFEISSQWYLFLYSLYWTARLIMGTGTGTIFFNIKNQYVFNIFGAIIGYFFNLWMIAKISCRQIKSNREWTKFQGSIRELMTMMKAEKISSHLRKKILVHFDNLFTRTYGLKMTTIRKQCTRPIKQSLCRAMYDNSLLMVLPFKDMRSEFYRMISTLCSEHHYTKDVPIIMVNDIINTVFIVQTGIVEILAVDGTRLKMLEKGCMFGNIDNIKSSRSMISAVPRKSTDLIYMKTSDLYKALKRYPVVIRRMSKHLLLYSLFYIESDMVVPSSLKYRTIFVEKTLRTKFLTSEVFRVMYMLISILSYLLTLFLVSFVYNPRKIIGKNKFSDQFYSGSRYFNYVLEITFCIFILGGFCKPVLVNGELVNNMKIIAKVYTKSAGFTINILSILPLYEISLLFTNNIYLTRYLHLNRVLRLYHVYLYEKALTSRLNVNVALATTVSSIIYVTVILHTMVCITYWSTIFDKPENEWVASSVCDDYYICTVYYVVSAITGLGFITILATSPVDIFIFMILTFTGRFMNAILIGNLCCGVRHMKQHFFSYVDARYQLRMFLCNKVSSSLMKSVTSYYDQLWGMKYARQSPVVLSMTPPSLVSELFIAAYGHHIFKNPIFAECHPDFLRQLILSMKMETFFPNNIIVKQGNLGTKLHIIHRGLVEVYHEEGSSDTMVDILEEGDSFGILEYLYACEQHSHTFKAISITEILYIKTEHLTELLRFFPASKHSIYEVFYGMDYSIGGYKR